MVTVDRQQFEDFVKANIAEADAAARELFKEIALPKVKAPQERWVSPGTSKNRPPESEKRSKAYIAGKCYLCGCDWDKSTPGCITCYARHKNRERVDARRAKNNLN